MKAADTHMTILAANLLAAIATTAAGQPWWFSVTNYAAGTLTILAYQGTGAVDRGQPGTGGIAAGEVLILAATIAAGQMAAAVVGTAIRVLGLTTQMSAIGRFLPSNQPK